MEHIIKKVEKNSIADELGIKKGDCLIEINQNEIKDVFDYRYYIKDIYIEILIKKENKYIIYEIEKEYNEDLGLVFNNDLMDEVRQCKNKCVFCFIDQLPKGMRETLYVKDDDIRLSFLTGNYVTMTNVNEAELDRIIKYHLSPINISIHTTDDEIRKKMMKNKNATGIIDTVKKIVKNGILVNAQIVLVKDMNDKEVLINTLDELLELEITLNSLSIVPVGITKYRNGINKIKPFSKYESQNVINTVKKYRKLFLKKHNRNVVYASDEFFIKADASIPSSSYYDDYPQIENGVGLVRLFMDDVYNNLKKEKRILKENISIITGVSFYPFMKEIVTKMKLNDKINIYKITNDFFGKTITVSGLLTAKDVIRQLEGKELGKRILMPSNMFRDKENTTLDDYTIHDIEKALKVKVYLTQNNAIDFLNKIFK